MVKIAPETLELHQKIIINFKMMMAINFFAFIFGMIFNQRFDIFNIQKADIGFVLTFFAMTFGLIVIAFFSFASAKTKLEPFLVMAIAFFIGCLLDMLIKKSISNEQTYNQIIPAIQLTVASGLFTTLLISTLIRLIELRTSFSFSRVPLTTVVIGFGVAIIVMSKQLTSLEAFTTSLIIMIGIVMLSYKILAVMLSNIPKEKLLGIGYEGINFTNLQTLTVLIFCSPLAFFTF